MKLTLKLVLGFTLLFNFGYSQEPQRLEHLDSILNIINTSTKGIRYNLSDTGINSELSEIGTTFFMNKYIILSNKKRRHYETTVNEKTNTFNNNMYCVNVDEEGNLIEVKLENTTGENDEIGMQAMQELLKNKEFTWIPAVYKGEKVQFGFKVPVSKR